MSFRRLSALAAVCLAFVGAPALAASPTVPPRDTMAQRMQACVVCHGEEGRATNDGYFPRIAGKPAGYLYNQLLNFRDGRRISPTMTTLVEHLSDTYLREIADYFAALELPYPPPRPTDAPAALLARGAALVVHGDARRELPACSECHGSRMTGVMPAVPGLLGLPQDYLAAQLGAWRSGARRAHAPDCMGAIAQRLDAADVVAVTTWLAAQALPVDPMPAPAPSTLPPDCGSGFE